MFGPTQDSVRNREKVCLEKIKTVCIQVNLKHIGLTLVNFIEICIKASFLMALTDDIRGSLLLRNTKDTTSFLTMFSKSDKKHLLA